MRSLFNFSKKAPAATAGKPQLPEPVAASLMDLVDMCFQISSAAGFYDDAPYSKDSKSNNDLQYIQVLFYQ